MQCRHCHRHHRAQAFYCGHCGRRLSELPGATPPLLPPLDPQYLRPGTRLGADGRYLITARLGEGGFGQVYRAIDLELYERECVVKRLVIRKALSPDLLAQVIESFTREAQLLSALSTPGHPAIPDIYEHLIDQHCLVMKYVAGESLALRLARHERGLTEEEVLAYGRAVCSALAYLHRQPGRPVLHRDVKPANILRDHEDRIWLIDFGLSKALPAALIPTGDDAIAMGGTAGYTPPEQLRGLAEPRSDVYALAITLVRLLTNVALPSSPPGADAIAALLPTTLRPELRALLLRGVSLEVGQRPTADEFLAALNAIDQDLSPPPPPMPLPIESTFVGRASELADLGRRLQQRRIMALVGFAGVGKTTLAAHLAAQAGPNTPVFWYHCSADTGVDRLVRQLAEFLAWHGRPTLRHTLQRQAIGGSVAAAPVDVEVALAALAGQGALVCIDDAQHLAGQAAAERLFAGLSRLAHAGQARVLVTARQRPAGIAPQDCAQLAGMSAADTRALLAQNTITPAAALTDQIYQLTEGNPQLLILAMDLLQRGDEPEHLSARLRQAPSVSDYLLREVHEHLSKAEQLVMSGLAALTEDGASQEVLEAALELGRLQQILIRLQQRHLLSVHATDGTPIYTQHALVRAFYHTALTLPERRQIHRRASAYYEHEAQNLLIAALHAYEAREISRCAALLTPDVQRFLFAGEATLVWRLLDAINTHVALHPDALMPAERIGLHLSLGEAAAFMGRRMEAQREFSAALALCDPIATLTARHQEARACRGLAQLLESEQPQAALQWLERGLAALDPTDQLERARLSNRIGSIQHQLGHFPAARAVLQAALAELPADQARLRADLLVNLGITCAAVGAYGAGREHLREALAIMRRTRNRWAEVGILHDLGMILEITGDWNAAESHYRQALQLAEELGGSSHRCDMLLALGILHTNRGQYAAAEQLLAQSLALADEQQARVSAVYIRSSLADLYLRLGRLADAAQMAAQAARLAEELGERSQAPEILRTQALVALAQGAQPLALGLAEQALALVHEQASPEDAGQGLRVRAEARLAGGDLRGALADCAASAALLAENPYLCARTQLVWSRALRASGDAERAAQLSAQARDVLDRLGVAPQERR